ncbi:hypothetical protein AK812_SmicGene44883 [Symbiodinium microadriaticum]|uniref:Uncharacterized protein n=1 Tax=Symbiodinium microadriaticum TaxID=2951 RepID=A0A1Q9BXD6_SYMMI|nr:hypothetical protein AK812_SmicGene44883 [Symbiodinium microadriaticum]
MGLPNLASFCLDGGTDGLTEYQSDRDGRTDGRAQSSSGAGHSAKAFRRWGLPLEAVKMHPGLEACRAGDASALKAELALGSFDAASTLDRFGGSGLHWAASGGHHEVCKLLVEHQAPELQR